MHSILYVARLEQSLSVDFPLVYVFASQVGDRYVRELFLEISKTFVVGFNKCIRNRFQCVGSILGRGFPIDGTEHAVFGNSLEGF